MNVITVLLVVALLMIARQQYKLRRLRSSVRSMSGALIAKSQEASRLQRRLGFRETAIRRQLATIERLGDEIARLEATLAAGQEAHGVIRSRCGRILVCVDGVWHRVVRFASGGHQLIEAMDYEVADLRQHVEEEAAMSGILAEVLRSLGAPDGPLGGMIVVVSRHTDDDIDVPDGSMPSIDHGGQSTAYLAPGQMVN